MEETRYRLGIAYLNWSGATARKLIDPPDYRLGRWYQKVGQSIEADAAFAMATKLKASSRN